jgi:hypothetical protein
LYDTPGFASAIASATAWLQINPNTGFNGGRVALQGGGRRLNGVSHNNVLEGLESFSLEFTGVPFTFERGIDVSVQFIGVSSASSAGANTFAAANYTLTWEGLSVRDQAGMLVTGYTALSTASGFDYAQPAAAVPEPSAAWLLLLGGGFVVLRCGFPAGAGHHSTRRTPGSRRSASARQNDSAVPATSTVANFSGAGSGQPAIAAASPVITGACSTKAP